MNECIHSSNMYSMPFHEMWHCKQVTDYEKKYGKITKENYKEYLAVLRAECTAAKLDRLGITEENVKEISEYADDMYSLNSMMRLKQSTTH